MRRARSVALGLVACLLLGTSAVGAQASDSVIAQEGIYDRPFIGSVASTSIGGYVEGNSNWFSEEGITDGLSFELRRFNLFLFASLSDRLRFVSELEFEHGTEEIALETALVDFRLSHALVLRAGVLLAPIGYLNQNHDSPNWDWVDRPLVTTTVVPSTLAEVGFGAYGRVPLDARWTLSWDAYLTNGLGADIVGGPEGRTDLAAGKHKDLLAEDNNGSPALSGRLAVVRHGLGELGVSWYGGAYNDFRLDGAKVEEQRRLDLYAVDVGATVAGVEVRGEAALATIDVPPGMAEVFGDRQWGGYLDLIVPLIHPPLDGRETVLAAGVRLERVDYNVGTFRDTGRSIGDEVTAISPGLSWRPRPGTVLRVNYRYQWTHDFPGNDPARGAGFQVGIATYF